MLSKIIRFKLAQDKQKKALFQQKLYVYIYYPTFLYKPCYLFQFSNLYKVNKWSKKAQHSATR